MLAIDSLHENPMVSFTPISPPKLVSDYVGHRPAFSSEGFNAGSADSLTTRHLGLVAIWVRDTWGTTNLCQEPEVSGHCSSDPWCVTEWVELRRLTSSIINDPRATSRPTANEFEDYMLP